VPRQMTIYFNRKTGEAIVCGQRPEVQGSVQGMPCLMIRCNISQ